MSKPKGKVAEWRASGSLERMVRVLRLNLKGCYFDAIKAGIKAHEFRLASKWEKRLAGKTYDEIHLLRGYPKRGDESRILRRRWSGYQMVTMTHTHFGPLPVRVLAIDVTKHLTTKLSDRRPEAMKKTESDNGGSMQRVVRCVCGGEHFHRNYPVAGRWCEFVKANDSGGVELVESTTDGLTRGKEPKFMRCDKCGKRVRNPKAPNAKVEGPAGSATPQSEKGN